jgi:chemotaxis protein methyltransferase CheR
MFDITPDEARSVFQAVEQLFGADLSGCAMVSFRLRLSRFLKDHSLGSVEDLIGKLTIEPGFYEVFIRDISVGSPDMFRDPDFWTHLRDELLPDLLKSRLCPEIVLPGCVTGNELYSLIVLLRESGDESRVDLVVSCRNSAIQEQIRAGKISTVGYKNSKENYRFFNPGSSIDAYFEMHNGCRHFRADLLEKVAFRVQPASGPICSEQTAMVLYRNRMLYMNREEQARQLKSLLSQMPEESLFVTGTGEVIKGLGLDHLFSVLSEDFKIYAITHGN